MEEQILVTVADQSKLDLVMELLSHFDLVQAQRISAYPLPKPAPTPPTGTDEDFWSLAGIWKDRAIDLERMRRDSFERRTAKYDQ